MERLLLVDGSNLLFQMYFGMPSRIQNADGKGIWGTLGFVGALIRMLRRTAPTHLAVLFDGEHENPRTAVDGAYKANREALPEEDSPFTQLPDIYRALDFLGIRHAETVDCETDDWMAGYAKRYGDREVILCSMDSDFFQLITERVSVLRYRGEKSILCGPAYIEEKFGIAPSQYADFKALTGDPSDNIKGVSGIGPKTAAALLLSYGDLSGILSHGEEISRASVRTSLLENAERVQRNLSLIRLTGEAELPFSLSELAYEDRGVTTTEVLKGVGLLP